MRVSTKGQYAIEVFCYFARYGRDKPTPLRDVADDLGISKPYLDQIIAPYAKAGLVQSTRGAGGGYSLTRRPEEYTLADILEISEDGLEPVDGERSAQDAQVAAMAAEVWEGLGQAISFFLQSNTLQDLVDNHADEDAYTFVI
jgi:Rrf2 family protein